MRIQFVEIQNFRKLKSIRIDFNKKTTLFVGANNSGKTSAMVALGHFLVDQNRFTTKDFTLSNWPKIDKIGTGWEANATQSTTQNPIATDWESVLPSMDVWLKVEDNEIHYISHLLPTLDWDGGLIGVRLRLEPKSIDELCKEYILARNAANTIIADANRRADTENCSITFWPRTMSDFLERRLNSAFTVRAYALDPTKHRNPDKGVACPQLLPIGCEPIERDSSKNQGNPFKGLIRINEINAQRGFGYTNNARSQTEGSSGMESRSHREQRKLSEQLRSYYTKHLDPTECPELADLDALQAIEGAQAVFDERLKSGFSTAFTEIEGLGYPGLTDSKLTITTRISPMDGLDHDAAVQYEVVSQNAGVRASALRLPEDYNGLGYQNLISMAFKLMSYRDGWMQIGKAGKKSMTESSDDFFLPPLHLVIVEEPEAHLHAQVQQVFIRKAYDILRNHDDLGGKTTLTTQLVVSTHSSHVAHECEFACLRYFRRLPASGAGEVPTSTIVNLSEVFGKKDETEKFVTRYLKAVHCDLFFADAAILVEGPAERMLVPHFIRDHFPRLNQCYITMLEIGGSHAHRLQPLIEHLGLTTLIITDIDGAEPTDKHAAAQPQRGKNLVTGNSTLKTWLPIKTLIDELLDLPESEKIKEYDPFFSIRVAYQIPVRVKFSDDAAPVEALSNTFEDALVFENTTLFKNLEGNGLIKKISTAIDLHSTPYALGEAMFVALKNAKKAEFALDLLDLPESSPLQMPTYINEGLSWLESQLKRKQGEIVDGGAVSIPVLVGGK